MINGNVEQASLTYRWNLEKMLSTLPGPGTSAFEVLCRELQPYGMTPMGVTLDAPSSRLGDIVLTISLLEDTAKLRLSYGWFELVVNNLLSDANSQIKNQQVLVRIVESVFSSLQKTDKEALKGKSSVFYAAHISLQNFNKDQFLHKHLIGSDTIPDLIPDAFAYRYNWSELKAGQEPRIVVFPSLVFPNALFVQLNFDYGDLHNPGEIAERILIDINRALTSFDLSIDLEVEVKHE